MNNRLLYSLAVTLMLAGMTACSSDEPANSGGQTPTPTPTPVPAASTLTMTIVADQAGSGSGTAAQPFTASHSQPLNVTLSQTVTYSDAQGQQQTVNPKAVIAATVKDDTIHAADLATLTKLTEPSPKTDTKAGNPQTVTRQQLFDIGEQEITFDLSHEIYSYTLNGKQTELPYAELKAPKYGAATPDQVSATRAVQGFGQMPVASVTAIRLTPVAATTRGTTVRDTTMYDVAVSFTVEATPRNTSTTAPHTLSVEVHYTAVVENATEVPNAATSIGYELNYRSGTSDEKSPFYFSAKDQLQLEWHSDSHCTYIAMEDLATHVVTLNPRAAITVSAKTDTIRWGDNKESIAVVSCNEPTITTYSEQPQVTDCMQTFTIGGQTVNISWKYEDYGSMVVEDTTVAMPYLLLEAPEVVDVSVVETAQSQKSRTRLAGKTYTMPKGQTRADGDSDIGNLQGGATYYEVTVRFRQQLKAMNTQEPIEETIEYVLTYIAEIGMELISTTYEKDYQWLEPWCDLPWRYNYIVRRIRTYSTGEKETDEFRLPVGGTVPPSIILSGRISGDEYKIDNLHFIYHELNWYDNRYDETVKNFKFITSTKTGVPDISILSWKVFMDRDEWTERNTGNYCKVYTDTTFSSLAAEESWYVDGFTRDRRIYILYDAPGYEDLWIRYEGPWFAWGDYFLYLDGQIIDFADYRMTYDFDVKVEDASFNGAPAKVFTHECNAKYLGKDFYFATVDTVYQIK